VAELGPQQTALPVVPRIAARATVPEAVPEAPIAVEPDAATVAVAEPDAAAVADAATVTTGAAATAPVTDTDTDSAVDTTVGGSPFHASGDDAMLAPLRTARVTAAMYTRGGSTISLRLDFEGGGRAAFKPSQEAWQSNPRKEIAAFRIDRLLGFGAVAPAIGRRFAVEELYAAMADGSRMMIPRLRREIITHTDDAAPSTEMVNGVVSWWIPVIANARIDGLGIDELDGIVQWRRQLKAGASHPPGNRDMLRQISNVLLFDFLIDNVDRWSGNNVRCDPSGRALFFMDNTMSFSRDRRGHRKGQQYLTRTQTFSRRIVERLRAVTEDELRAALVPGADGGPFEYLLSPAELRAVRARREFALAYIDELIARHGEAKVLAFP
jgi:hypothetical protein